MNLINHVAIILDGNGRWGLKNAKSRNYGHKQGVKSLEKIVNSAISNNIRYLTLFVFSTENWKRPEKEVSYLFELLKNFLKSKISNLIKKKIKLKFIGNKKINKGLKKILDYSERKTKSNTGLQINLALNYGSRDEIVETIKKMIKKKIPINVNNISNNLFTKNIPDPDILIRTGNTKRLSNFLLWQLSYTEIFFEKKLWPDFTENDFKVILNTFKKIKRNYGAI